MRKVLLIIFLTVLFALTAAMPFVCDGGRAFASEPIERHVTTDVDLTIDGENAKISMYVTYDHPSDVWADY